MSFERFNRGSGVRIHGLSESIRAVENIIRSWPNVKTEILREAANYFVNNAKGRVHIVSGRLRQNITTESIGPSGAIVAARTPYAEVEEKRKGLKPGPNTPHTYMQPAAEDTNKVLPGIIKKHTDDLFGANKTL